MPIEEAIRIAEMTERDLEEILAIEIVSFPTPWTQSMFMEELISPISQNIVAWLRGEIAGYIDSWIVRDEIHILHLAVRPDLRRRGIATFIMTEMIRRSHGRGAFAATLEVRRSNRGAICFYERLGFEVRGIRPHYYADTGEDALIMWAYTETKDALYAGSSLTPVREDCP